jgi:hypothetical protein
VSIPFLRTPQGLNNQPQFVHMDSIVFAEGGSKHPTVEEIRDGAGETFTLDTAFWSTIVRLGIPQRRIEVRSVGNKQTLEAIAKLVAEGSVTRIVVAMDRDFDDRRGRKINHANVFYTYGYSWENDVFAKDVLIDFVENLALPLNALLQAREAIRNASIDLENCFSDVVRLDHVLASKGAEITNREELLGAVQISERVAPRIRLSRIKAELKRCRSVGLVKRKGPKACAEVERDLHGHTIARWWLGNIQHLLRSLNGLKMSNEVITRMALASFARRRDSSGMRYYRDMTATAAL